jgi:hypothetical protein
VPRVLGGDSTADEAIGGGCAAQGTMTALKPAQSVLQLPTSHTYTGLPAGAASGPGRGDRACAGGGERPDDGGTRRAAVVSGARRGPDGGSVSDRGTSGSGQPVSRASVAAS